MQGIERMKSSPYPELAATQIRLYRRGSASPKASRHSRSVPELGKKSHRPVSYPLVPAAPPLPTTRQFTKREKCFVETYAEALANQLLSGRTRNRAMGSCVLCTLNTASLCKDSKQDLSRVSKFHFHNQPVFSWLFLAGMHNICLLLDSRPVFPVS